MSVPFELPGYEDLEVVGSGGYGRVYRARQPAFDRTVAIKLLYGGLDDVATRRRFQRECQSLGSVSSHPNIVPVYDAGETRDGEPYLVMDFVRGGSLADLMARSGPMPWQDVTAIGVKLAGALHTAHQAGVLHRDIKPENILLSDYGEPQLADFGIAQRSGGDTATATGTAMTPSHTPPERFSGGPASTVTDVYALASTLFTMLVGRSPFRGNAGESIYAMIARVMADPVPDLRHGGVPDAVAQVIEQGLSKDPAERPQSARELGQHLQDVQSAMGLPVTPLPVPRQDGVTPGGEPVPDARVSGAVTPPASDRPTDSVPFLPSGSTRRRWSGRWVAGGSALLLVIAVGAVVGAAVARRPSPAQSGPTPTAAGAGPSSAPFGTAYDPTSTSDVSLVGQLLQPGSPSGVGADVRWAALDPTTAKRLEAAVPVACVNLYNDISPSARGSLRLERAPSTTALVQVVYRGAPDSTEKAMTGLHAGTGCRLSGRTITRLAPAGTPGLTTAATDLGADVVAFTVESPGETFHEIFFHRGEIVCAMIWSGPYGDQRNWSIVLSAARAAAERLPRL